MSKCTDNTINCSMLHNCCLLYRGTNQLVLFFSNHEAAPLMGFAFFLH